MAEYKQLQILVAEDDEGHAELIRDGLESSGVCNPIIHFFDGQELWDYLNSEQKDSSKSYLVLLDINMPRMDGVEVLRRMKGNEALKEIPVMMLTTTDDPREVEQCYRLGCNVYITKPVDFSKFADTLHRLGLFVQVVKI